MACMNARLSFLNDVVDCVDEVIQKSIIIMTLAIITILGLIFYCYSLLSNHEYASSGLTTAERYHSLTTSTALNDLCSEESYCESHGHNHTV